MKRSWLSWLALVCLASAGPAAQDLAVRGKLVHTLAGPPLEDGVVLVQGGKITAVGRGAELPIPAGMRTLYAAVVTPGLVDAHTCVGLAGWMNVDHDKDELETSAPLQPELRAIDAYNPQDPLVEWVRSFGVTTLHTGHAPGELVSGQTMIVKTRGNTVESAVVVPEAMVAATLGSGATREGKESPGTRSKAAAMLRAKLIAASEYAAKRAAATEEPPARDLGLETLAAVLARERPLLVTAQRAQDILTALRLAEEFRFELVLDGAAESYLLLDQLKAAGVSVLCHPPMARAHGETENLSMETPAALQQAGIPFALQSGYESYVPRTRVVLFEASVAAVRGLGFDAALAAITIDAARLLGIEDRVGSLEVGKDGDFALYDGDPLEYTSHCIGVVIEGEVVSETVR
jgi:imidazolonepropionase-like amidohydrolase